MSLLQFASQAVSRNVTRSVARSCGRNYSSFVSSIMNRNGSSTISSTIPSVMTRSFGSYGSQKDLAFDPDILQKPTSMYDFATFLPNIMAELGEKSGKDGIAIVGMQSSGKTSFVEAITGLEIGEKRTGAATKRPIRIKCYSVATGPPYIKFGTLGEKIYDMDKARRLYVEKNSGNFSMEPLEILYYAQGNIDVMITDYPGHILTAGIGKSHIPQAIEDMSIDAIRDDDTHVVLVLQAPADPDGSVPLKLISEANQFHNTTAIFTKIDMLVSPNTDDPNFNYQHARDIIVRKLRDNKYAEFMDCIGVSLRSEDAVDKGITSVQQMELEEEFYKKTGLDTMNLNLGVRFAREKLSEVLVANAQSQIPAVKAKIQTRIEDNKKSREMFNTLSSHDNAMLTVSAFTEDLIDIVGNNSKRRKRMDKNVCAEKNKRIVEAFNEEYDKQFSWAMPTKSDYADFKKPIGNTDESMLLDTIRNVIRSNYIDDAKVDDIELYFDSHQWGSFDPVLEHGDMTKGQKGSTLKSAMSEFFRFEYTSHSEEYRKDWSRALGRTIDNLVDYLPEEIREISANSLLSQLQGALPNSDDEFPRQVISFIFNEIADQSKEDAFTDIVAGNILSVKSPAISPVDMGYVLNRLFHQNNPGTIKDYQIRTGFFGTESYPITFPVYGPVFTEVMKYCLCEIICRQTNANVKILLSNPLVKNVLKYEYDYFRNLNPEEKDRELERKENRLNEALEMIEDIELEASKVHENAEKRKVDVREKVEKRRKKNEDAENYRVTNSF